MSDPLSRRCWRVIGQRPGSRGFARHSAYTHVGLGNSDYGDDAEGQQEKYWSHQRNLDERLARLSRSPPYVP
jgi:hypothetical protein